MGEFVKKTMMGYREVPGGQSDPECTHVILTETEYAELLQRISDAEREASSAKAKAIQEIGEAERKAKETVGENNRKANQTIAAWKEALEKEQAECAHQRSLNDNLLANISRQIKELAEQLSEYISAPIYETYIRSAVAVEEAQANRADIFDYAGKSTVAEDYRAFIEEFLKGVNA